MHPIIDKIVHRAAKQAPRRGVEQVLGDFRSFVNTLEALPEASRLQASKNMLFALAKLILDDGKFRTELFNEGEKFGVHLMPTHFYSPVPVASQVPDSVFELDLLNSPALPLNIEKQRERFKDFGKYSSELSKISFEPRTDAYSWENSAFGSIDATVYHGMIRSVRPARIIEIGSGYSTMIATEAAKLNGSTRVTSVEPYPMASLTANSSIDLIEKFIQDVDLSVFDELVANDVLFVDSTHVSRVGSDVNHIFARILPRLKPGVYVHFHDIFLPFEYPKYWIKDSHLFWNEQYMLQNFLAFNSEFETVATNFYWLKTDPQFLLECFPVFSERNLAGAGSFWIRRRN